MFLTILGLFSLIIPADKQNTVIKNGWLLRENDF